MATTDHARLGFLPWAGRIFRPASTPRVAPVGVPTVRARLIGFAAICAGVAAVVLTTLLLIYGAEYRVETQRDTEEQAISITQSIDSKVAVTQAVLASLATSPLLWSGDFSSLYSQAKSLTPAYGSRVLLYERDAAGVRHVLLNTGLPFGTPQPPLRDPESNRMVEEFLADIITTRTPQVSDAVVASLDGQRVTAVGIPVIRDDQVRYVLVGVLPTMDSAPIFGPQGLPPRWFSGVADRRGRYVAGQDAPDRAANLPVLDAAFQEAIAKGETTFEAHTENGGTLYVAVSRSTKTGWLSIVAVPEQIFTDAWYRALLVCGAAGGLLLLATFGLAFVAEPRVALPLRRRLIADEQRFRIMADTVPSILFTTDIEGMCDYVSDAFYAYTGMPAGSAQGRGWVDALHSEDGKRVLEMLSRPIAAASEPDGETRSETQRGDHRSLTNQPTDTEIRLRSKDGTYRWFLIRVHILSDAGGRLTKCFGTATDIEDVKRAERALRQRVSELARLNRRALASELSAAIAHELNQPLGAILSNTETAELILNSPSPSMKEIKEILADIKRDDQRASEVIWRLRRLLTKSDVEAQVIDLNDVVREALQFLSVQASERNVRLDRMLAPQALRISGDRVQLQQVILNLVVNGIEALEQVAAGASKVVSCTTLMNGSTAEVLIADSGPGIPADKVQQVFEPFFTTKPQGMGMGLSIARTIIEAHGGRMWAKARGGGGAEFGMSLPLAKARRE